MAAGLNLAEFQVSLKRWRRRRRRKLKKLFDNWEVGVIVQLKQWQRILNDRELKKLFANIKREFLREKNVEAFIQVRIKRIIIKILDCLKR